MEPSGRLGAGVSFQPGFRGEQWGKKLIPPVLGASGDRPESRNRFLLNVFAAAINLHHKSNNE